MIGTPEQYNVIFNRCDLESITERFTTYIVQQHIEVNTAWKQAVEEQAQLIEYKLELMEEGALEWDLPSRQLKAMREGMNQEAQFQ